MKLSQLTLAVLGGLCIAATAQAQNNQPFRIGTIVDMSGVYSAHGGPGDPDAVVAKMKETPIKDFYTKNGKIRDDGRMVYDMLLAEAKKPEESKSDWVLLKINATIPADEAYRPLSESTCKLVKKS